MTDFAVVSRVDVTLIFKNVREGKRSKINVNVKKYARQIQHT